MNDTLTLWAWGLSFKSQWLLCDAMSLKGFPGGSRGKESTCNAGDLGWIPGLGRSPRGGHGKPLQYSCLENPHGQRSLAGYRSWVTESDTTERLSTHLNSLLRDFMGRICVCTVVCACAWMLCTCAPHMLVCVISGERSHSFHPGGLGLQNVKVFQRQRS